MSTLEKYPGDSLPWKACKTDPKSPAIMQSMDSLLVNNRDSYCSPYGPPSNYGKLSISGMPSLNGINSKNVPNQEMARTSFMLIDEREYLKISSAEQFIEKLGCLQKDIKVKVVCIFGNTGDGKSHTLNHTFFNGQEVFKTSNDQSSCTLGVWGAFDPNLRVICLDTEGLLSVSSHENERTRLLLKVLAVSDIVIYRTRSERLHRNLFSFLGNASRIYTHHLQGALQALSRREDAPNISALGPSIIIFHETRHTRPLANNCAESADDILKNRFIQMKLDIEAFRSIEYIGVQTLNPPTNYNPLRAAIQKELDNTTVRLARKPHIVYNTFKILNDRFSGVVNNFSNVFFPDQYFTCPVKCRSCDTRCRNSMGHLREGIDHHNETKCRYQHQYENVMYLCIKCHANGKEEVVTSRTLPTTENSWYGLAKYAWSGYVMECPRCGEIYRSRQYWYGNKNPEDIAVRTEVVHVWNAANMTLLNQNAAQKLIDGVSYISDAVTNVSIQPTKVITAWVADQVAPSYWRPNNEIKHCHQCKAIFGLRDTKHHCRACGEGFCDTCSLQSKTVPARNWHTPVRVCDECYTKDLNNSNEISPPVGVRKVSEQVVSTLNVVGTVLTYSKSLIKDTVRPTYWVPDSELTNCSVCGKAFTDILPLHHCRDCGRGVCQECSQHRRSVPRRGWDKPVRVCDSCIKID